MNQLRLVVLISAGALQLACATKAVEDDESSRTEMSLVTNDGDAASDEPAPRKPPPEAFEACRDLEVGSECVVSIDGREIEGNCRAGRGDDGLVCMPRHHGPPPQAYDACTSKQSGDACSVELGGGQKNGECRELPNDGKLACVPEGMRPPPPPEGDRDLEATLDRLEREIGGS